MEQLKFKIENFEGPLDLLLHLVSRHKVALTDVKISLLIDQYLAFMQTIGPDELEPTSEFIEMAARLVHMKSVALLPRRDEADALERELVGQLIEYQYCKQAAERLRFMQEGVYYAVREPANIPLPPDYAKRHDKLELLSALRMISRPAAGDDAVIASRFEEIVAAPVISVASKALYILRSLRKGMVSNAKELFSAIGSKSESIAVFLGLLELINANRVTVSKSGAMKSVKRG